MSDFDDLLAGVRYMATAGRSIDEIEDEIIDPSGLNEGDKSALWLYAWSFVPPQRQREAALEHRRRLGLIRD